MHLLDFRKLLELEAMCYIKYSMSLIHYNCILACDKCELVMDELLFHLVLIHITAHYISLHQTSISKL